MTAFLVTLSVHVEILENLGTVKDGYLIIPTSSKYPMTAAFLEELITPSKQEFLTRLKGAAGRIAVRNNHVQLQNLDAYTIEDGKFMFKIVAPKP